MSIEKAAGTRTTGDTAEHVIFTGAGVLFSITPELTTTGTITIRDAAATGGSNVVHVCAIGLTQAGKVFGPRGMAFQAGCTVQLSAAGDLSWLSWTKAP